MSTKYPPSRLE